MKTLLIATILLAATAAQAQQKDMTFFITSAGPGKGADLGGLDGRRRALPGARQGGGRRRPDLARLSEHPRRRRVNARDRIGKGPWQNAKGEVIAKSVDDLHGTNNASTSRPR